MQRRRSSIAALEQIYYVVAGLSITNAISVGIGKLNGTADAKAVRDAALANVLNPTALAAVPSKTVQICLFVVFFLTVIRFVQGTATHFGSHKEDASVLNRGRFAAIQPLIDFLGFGLQASLFVVLASELERPDWFMGALLTLLGFDVVWIAITLRYDQEAKAPLLNGVLWQWLVSNGVLIVLIVWAWYFHLWIWRPWIDSPDGKVGAILFFSLFAFVLDYWMNRQFYFGATGKSA